MKYQSLFSWKNKKKFNFSSAEFTHCMVSVKYLELLEDVFKDSSEFQQLRRRLGRGVSGAKRNYYFLNTPTYRGRAP